MGQEIAATILHKRVASQSALFTKAYGTKKSSFVCVLMRYNAPIQTPCGAAGCKYDNIGLAAQRYREYLHSAVAKRGKE